MNFFEELELVSSEILLEGIPISFWKTEENIIQQREHFDNKVDLAIKMTQSTFRKQFNI